MAKILVVEDTANIQKFLQYQLGKLGHEISVASDGAQALAMVEAERPDVVILDVMMPVKNGFEVVLELQSNQSTNSIPVIMLSAKNQPHDIAAGMGRGGFAYMTKPFNIPALVAKIDDALSSTY